MNYPCEAISFWQPFWLYPQTLVDLNFFSIKKTLSLFLFKLANYTHTHVRKYTMVKERLRTDPHPAVLVTVSIQRALPARLSVNTLRVVARPAVPNRAQPCPAMPRHVIDLSSLLFVVLSATLFIPKHKPYNPAFPIPLNFCGSILHVDFCKLLLLLTIFVKFLYVLSG